ncbi:MAG: hypothetical protein LBK52_00190, partial [Deltaproteobacteria bacterium]|nr:hypothetical protein [Deltaproteobacteria bacterium]
MAKVYLKNFEQECQELAKELFVPPKAVERMLRRYEDEILHHPEIKPLVESGEWDKLTPMYHKG